MPTSRGCNPKAGVSIGVARRSPLAGPARIKILAPTLSGLCGWLKATAPREPRRVRILAGDAADRAHYSTAQDDASPALLPPTARARSRDREVRDGAAPVGHAGVCHDQRRSGAPRNPGCRCRAGAAPSDDRGCGRLPFPVSSDPPAAPQDREMFAPRRPHSGTGAGETGRGVPLHKGWSATRRECRGDRTRAAGAPSSQLAGPKRQEHWLQHPARPGPLAWRTLACLPTNWPGIAGRTWLAA